MGLGLAIVKRIVQHHHGDIDVDSVIGRGTTFRVPSAHSRMILPLPKVQLPGPAALRALARAFANFGDFDRFVTGLQSALEQSAPFEHTAILLDSAVAQGGQPFQSGVMSVPLVGAGGKHGMLQASPRSENRQFGAEDLHLLAGLADFLSAVLDQAMRTQDARHSQELLRFLLNQAPIGLAAYTPERRLLVANDLGRDWLGEAESALFEIEAGQENFHLPRLRPTDLRRSAAARPMACG